MATYNLNVTASVDLLGSDISGSQSTDFAIANPLPASSYFTFETVRNSDGFYDSSSPKNMAGTYTLGAGLAGLVKSDYIASVVVEPGGGTLTFVPTNYISGSSLNLRGTTSPPQPTGTSFDADYQAVLDYATTQGYTLPSTSQQTLQNQLVVDLKIAGVWSKLDTFAVFATDGDSDFALIDWINLSQYTAYNSPTFTSNSGFFGDGVSAYIDTNFNPSTSGVNYTLDDASRIMYGEFPTDSLYPESAAGTANNITRNVINHIRQRINQGPNSLTTGLSPSNWAGPGDRLRTIHRTSSTNVEMFADTTQSSGTATSVALYNGTQWILAGNLAFAPSTNIFKIYGMGASLVSENTDLYNAINTYITSL